MLYPEPEKKTKISHPHPQGQVNSALVTAASEEARFHNHVRPFIKDRSKQGGRVGRGVLSVTVQPERGLVTVFQREGHTPAQHLIQPELSHRPQTMAHQKVIMMRANMAMHTRIIVPPGKVPGLKGMTSSRAKVAGRDGAAPRERNPRYLRWLPARPPESLGHGHEVWRFQKRRVQGMVDQDQPQGRERGENIPGIFPAFRTP